MSSKTFNLLDFYQVMETPELLEISQQIESLQKEIQRLQLLREDLLGTLFLKNQIDWTYHSNAIEGSSLTRGETAYFIQEGITVEGKPFQDYLDARNHANTIEFIYRDVLLQKREITSGLLKEINASLLHGISHTIALDQYGQPTKKPATPGQFKRFPNHVLLPNGEIHYYVDPLHVIDEIETLCHWLSTKKTLHAVSVSAISHYQFVRIHPFDDGNGRGARILMNLILLQAGFSPAIIKVEFRKQYLDALQLADQGHAEPFILFVAQQLKTTQLEIIADLQQTLNPV